MDPKSGVHFWVRCSRDAHTNAKDAARPSAALAVWSRPHFSIIARLSGPADAGSISMSRLFVGMMAKKVKGQFAIMKRAPSIQPAWPFDHQAAKPNAKPARASGACMAVPRL